MPGTLRRLASIFLAAALGLSGLVFMPQAQHVFWAPEAFAARILAPLAALLAFAAQREGKPAPPRAPLGLLWLLIGCWFLSAAFAFRSDLAAAELAGWLAGPLVFSAVWSLGGNAKLGRRLVAVILAAGLLQALYGIVQSAGWEPGHLKWAVSFGGRAGAFLGNPNFLGGHLALLLPLAAALAMDDRSSRAGRSAKWILAALLAAGLVVSQTRGAWLGAGLGLGLFFYACKRWMPGLLWRNRGGLAAFAAAGLLALGLFFAGHANNLARLQNLGRGDEELARRMTLMRCTLSLAAQHPLLGVGPGNYRIAFPSAQAAGIPSDAPASRPYINSEHAHNDLLQMAGDAGLPAALLYLALLLWVFRALWKGLAGWGREVTRSEEAFQRPLWAAGILGSLAALQLHGLANFPFLIAPTQMTAWALAALGLRAVLQPGTAKAGSFWKPWILAAGAAIWLMAAYGAGRMIMKDALWWGAEGEANLGHDAEAEGRLLATLRLDPKEDRLWKILGSVRQRLHADAGAAAAYQACIRLNPHDHEARVKLGQIFAASGAYAQAEEALGPAAREAPNLGAVWEPYAVALAMQGKSEQALQAYLQASSFAVSAPLLENKAAVLGNLGRYDDALVALDDAEKMAPGRAKNALNRAITHFKMDLKAQAKRDLDDAAKRGFSGEELDKLKKAMR